MKCDLLILFASSTHLAETMRMPALAHSLTNRHHLTDNTWGGFKFQLGLSKKMDIA
jgi:hypothetical protein